MQNKATNLVDDDDMEIKEVFDEKVPIEVVQEQIQLVAKIKKEEGATTFVSYEKFLEIKYSIDTVASLFLHPCLSLITTTMVKSRDISEDFKSKGKINDTVSDSEREKIRSFADYILYTNSANTVIMTLEKLLRVAAKVKAQFTYTRKALRITVSFVENTAVRCMTISELVNEMELEYKKVAKKLKIVDPIFEGAKILDSLIIRQRYTFENSVKVPQHLLVLPYVNAPFDTKNNDYYTNETMDTTVQQIRDSSAKSIESTEDPTVLITGIKTFVGSTVHALDDIIKLPDDSTDDLIAMVKSIYKDEAITVKQDVFFEWISQLKGQTDNQLAEHTLQESYGAVSLGWLAAPKNPNTTAAHKIAARKRELEAKFSKGTYVFYYIKSEVDFIFVESSKGRHFVNITTLEVHLKLLQRLFHFLQLLAVGSRKIVKDYTTYVTTLFSKLADSLTMTNKTNKARFQNQYVFNYRVWSRVTVVSTFGSVKPKSLPSKYKQDDGEKYDAEEKIEAVDSISGDEESSEKRDTDV
jgi:hypothetical protein